MYPVPKPKIFDTGVIFYAMAGWSSLPPRRVDYEQKTLVTPSDSWNSEQECFLFLATIYKGAQARTSLSTGRTGGYGSTKGRFL